MYILTTFVSMIHHTFFNNRWENGTTFITSDAKPATTLSTLAKKKKEKEIIQI